MGNRAGFPWQQPRMQSLGAEKSGWGFRLSPQLAGPPANTFAGNLHQLLAKSRLAVSRPVQLL